MNGCNSCSHELFDQIRPYPGFDGVNLVVCQACGLMQARPCPSETFLSDYYRNAFGNDLSRGFHHTRKDEKGFRRRGELQFNFIKKMCEVGPRGSNGRRKILDVGCHAASLLYFFKRKGWDVTGVDPNPRSRYGKIWYGIDVTQESFLPGMFAPASFDAILHSHALEHVRDPFGYLREFYRLLKPGGWVFIEVPNETREKVATRKVIPHLYFFTPETLAGMAAKAGFRVKCTHLLGVPLLKGSLFGRAGLTWFSLRSHARYDACGRLDLRTFFPFFGRLFREDRFFKGYHPGAEMLRAILEKQG